MSKLFFKKETNGNVTIRKISDNSIIYSLPGNQAIFADNANSNNLIIKSAIANNQNRGIVINYKDSLLIKFHQGERGACHFLTYYFP